MAAPSESYPIQIARALLKHMKRDETFVINNKTRQNANMTYKKLLHILTIVIIYITIIQCKVTYTFLEFPYKETPKNEATYLERETQCALKCSDKLGIIKTLCTRQCISPSCFADLYEKDLLEEGEVDVRMNSFKGCFSQRHRSSSART